MTEQIELKLAPGIRHTSREVFFPADLTLDQWTDYGRLLGAMDTSVDFWRARWLKEGRDRFGMDRVTAIIREFEAEAASGQMRFDVAGLKRSDLLNEALEWTEQLEPAHHFILAKAKLDATGQKMWRELAIEKKLSPNELQESIRLGSVTKIAPGSVHRGREGVASFQGLAVTWTLLRRQLGDDPDKWSKAQWAEALEFLKEIEIFIQQGRAALKTSP